MSTWWREREKDGKRRASADDSLQENEVKVLIAKILDIGTVFLTLKKR